MSMDSHDMLPKKKHPRRIFIWWRIIARCLFIWSKETIVLVSRASSISVSGRQLTLAVSNLFFVFVFSFHYYNNSKLSECFHILSHVQALCVIKSSRSCYCWRFYLQHCREICCVCLIASAVTSSLQSLCECIFTKKKHSEIITKARKYLRIISESDYNEYFPITNRKIERAQFSELYSLISQFHFNAVILDSIPINSIQRLWIFHWKYNAKTQIHKISALEWN